MRSGEAIDDQAGQADQAPRADQPARADQAGQAGQAQQGTAGTPPRQVSPRTAWSAVGTANGSGSTADPEPPAGRRSFLQQYVVEEPATRGWRGALNRTGARVAPSEAERLEREDVLVVAQRWGQPRTIAVVNGKGGAGKTPATAMLSAAFARHSSGVLAWENNQTRGTLGWRTEHGTHDATLLDLLPHVPQLLTIGAQSANLAAYTHHQVADRYDVLRAQPLALAADQRVEPSDVSAIHRVVSKYYRLILMDSGNDESDPMWQRMLVHTDQLVVPTTTRDDHAEAGALLLEALAQRDEHSRALAAGAVVVVSQADPKADVSDLARVADGFSVLAREVVTIPFDPAMVDGVLRWDALRPATRRAWLAAGAAVGRGL